MVCFCRVGVCLMHACGVCVFFVTLLLSFWNLGVLYDTKEFFRSLVCNGRKEFGIGWIGLGCRSRDFREGRFWYSTVILKQGA